MIKDAGADGGARERAAGVPADHSPLPKPAELNGIMTEQALLQRLFGPNVTAVATDKFINKSKDAYNLPFLAREVTQNWVDHNPKRGTLDGVQVDVPEHAPPAKSLITISGGWEIDDLTGLTHLHSDKPEEGESAGGNGIGLKQVAIRYLRDFGVSRFDIDGSSRGQGFRVSYRLVKASDANGRLEALGVRQKLRHDWLVADLVDAPENAGGGCRYTIETDNREVVESLRQVERIGVSSSHPLLTNSDYVGSKGSIKWQTAEEFAAKRQTGLFINGQAWSFREDGKTIEDHFKGPEGVTVRLNDLKHDMSIDRPPVDKYHLERYVDGLVTSMSKEEVVEQLRRSEHIWGGVDDPKYQTERPGCFVLIEKMADKLAWKHGFREFQAAFPGKTYLCRNEGVSDEQAKQLRGEGVVLCPAYFERLGVPKASSRFSSLDQASRKKPDLSGYKQREIAREFGFVVGFDEIAKAKAGEFLEAMMGGLGSDVAGVEETGANSFRVRLKSKMPEDILFHPLHSPRNDEQRTLRFIRGVVKAGMESGVFQRVFTSQGEYVTTYTTQYDSVTGETMLLARNVRNDDARGTFIEFEMKPKDAERFRALTKASARPGEEAEAEPKAAGRRRWRKVAAVAAGVAGAAALTAGLLLMRPPARSDADAPAGGKPKIVASGERVPGGTNEARVEMGTNSASPNVKNMNSPEVDEALKTLERAIPTNKPSGDEAQQYREWKAGGDFYGQVAQRAEYLSGKTLRDLLADNNLARIEPAGGEAGGLNSALQALANRAAAPEDRVEGFEIVLKPSERQLAQLGLLRTYLHLATGAAIPHDFLIFRGKGAKGVNIGGDKVIGFHEEMLKTSFEEAVGTGAHEVAHTHSMGHGRDFIAALQATMSAVNGRLTDINEKLQAGSELTATDRAISDVRDGWDKLRAR
jgi:hypothetical protein